MNRRTKIVATLGPATATADGIGALLDAGVNVIRINASHGTPEERGRWIETVRREALDAVTGFDERYFLYWEDADLCRRLRRAGYHVRYVPGATAIHRVGQSSRTARVPAIRAFHDSAYLYYSTHNAPSPRDPKRLAAKMILGAREWWLLRSQK